MKEIIQPIKREILTKELTEDKFVRHTNYGDNHIYIVNHHNAPNTMLEIGRLREEAFREAGGGTGKDADIDKYDTSEIPYEQLIVWNDETKEILGGYRFIDCSKAAIDENNKAVLATRGLFNMSKKFEQDYLPYTIELGRSFVQPQYQASKNARQAVFTLDNLWDGLGALSQRNPHIKHFFGKVTMYTSYNKIARDTILYFLNTFFGDKENLVYPEDPIHFESDMDEIASWFTGDDYKQNYRTLSLKVRELGENIPPLINSYMNLSSTMKVFGTAINHNFGDVEETGILVTIEDIFDAKKERHLKNIK